MHHWTGVLITDEDVGLELHVAMRFLIVVIVIMRPRLVYSDCILKFLSFISMLFLVAVKIIDYDLPHGNHHASVLATRIWGTFRSNLCLNLSYQL